MILINLRLLYTRKDRPFYAQSKGPLNGVLQIEMEPESVLTEDEFKCFLKVLGKRIRTLRKDKKLNMRDIMIASGYYDAQWRKYEAGGSMNLMSLMKVALALDVSLVSLLDGLGQWPMRSVAEIEAVAGLENDRADDSSVDLETVSKAVSRKRLPAKKTV